MSRNLLLVRVVEVGEGKAGWGQAGVEAGLKYLTGHNGP